MADEKRVVFSTSFVEKMDKKINDGFQIHRSESPYFNNIQGVRKEGLTFKMSKEELNYYIKCKLDVKYFANNFCKVKIEDGSYDIIKLRDYQLEILDMFDNNKFSILMSSRQVGKCADFLTTVSLYDCITDSLIETSLYELYFKYKKRRTIYDILKYNIYKLIQKLS